MTRYKHRETGEIVEAECEKLYYFIYKGELFYQIPSNFHSQYEPCVESVKEDE